MGRKACKTYFVTPAYGLWTFDYGVTTNKFCQLCSNRTADSVLLPFTLLICPESTNKMHRLAHRIRDMQSLPYVVVTNPHISQVYELYYSAFEAFRRVREIKTLKDNENFCKTMNETLRQHLTVIPKLAMGVLECRDLMPLEDMDKFMNTILRSVCQIALS